MEIMDGHQTHWLSLIIKKWKNYFVKKIEFLKNLKSIPEINGDLEQSKI